MNALENPYIYGALAKWIFGDIQTTSERFYGKSLNFQRKILEEFLREHPNLLEVFLEKKNLIKLVKKSLIIFLEEQAQASPAIYYWISQEFLKESQQHFLKKSVNIFEIYLFIYPSDWNVQHIYYPRSANSYASKASTLNWQQVASSFITPDKFYFQAEHWHPHH